MNSSLLRYGFLAWLALALIWCLIRFWVLEQYYSTLKLPTAGDLRWMLFAVDAARVHGWTWVFDPATFAPAVHAAVGVTPQPFRNPPVIVLVISILARIPWPAVAWIWVALNAALFAICALLVSGTVSPSRRVALLAAILGSFPAFVALGQGNDTAIALLGVALSYRLAVAEREVLAGFALALASFKPQMMFLLPIALLASGRWRLVVSAAAGVALLFAAAVAVVGPAAAGEWVRGLFGLYGQDSRVLGEIDTASYYLPHFLIPVLILAGAIVVGLVGWWAARRQRALEITFAAGLIASLLTTPYADPQEFSALVIAGWLVWLAWPRPLVALAAALTYAVVNPFLFLYVPSPIPWLEVAVLAGIVVAVRRLPAQQVESSMVASAEPV